MTERRRIITTNPVAHACVPDWHEVIASERRLIMGIDPGQSGGLAVTESKANAIILYTRMPEGNGELWAWMRRYAGDPGNTSVYIESVHAFSMGISGAFKFGVGYGRLLAFLTALNIEPVKVQPATWQRALNIPTTRKPVPADFRKADGGARTTKAVKALLQSEHKEDIRKRAQELFPQLDLWQKTKNEQMAVCDSLLICEYGRHSVGIL